MDANVDITPVGIARREDSTELKPRFLIMIPLKVMSPVIVSNAHVLMSCRSMLTSVGNVDCDVKEEDQPRLWIDQRLDSLIPLPSLVHDACLVFGEPLHPEYLLLLGQKEGVHRGVWKKYEREN